jgi:hypothetical protein
MYLVQKYDHVITQPSDSLISMMISTAQERYIHAVSPLFEHESHDRSPVLNHVKLSTAQLVDGNLFFSPSIHKLLESLMRCGMQICRPLLAL